jgi:chaperonin GroES
MNCKLKPIKHMIIVEERTFEEKTKGGILIPENNRTQYQNMSTEGIIVALGTTAFEYLPEECRPKIGDVVHFQKYDGIGKRYNEKNFRILADENVYAISDKYLETNEEIIVNS